MRELSKAIRVRLSTNCGGPEENFLQQDFIVESCDVGREMENYLGYWHARYKFRRDDVGRVIRVISQPIGYRFWSFMEAR